MRKSTALVASAVLIALVSIGLFENRRSAAQFPEALRPAPKWEYKTIRTGRNGEEAAGELNPLGEEGWELCAAVQPERGFPFLVLKRPITDRGRGDR